MGKAGFFFGFLLGVAGTYAAQKTVLYPEPAEYADRFKRAVIESPIEYKTEIEGMYNFTKDLMDTKISLQELKGFVDYSDLKLQRVRFDEQTIGLVVNKKTGESLPVIYVNGRTAAGMFNNRLRSVQYEAMQNGDDAIKGLIAGVGTVGERIKNSLGGLDELF